MAGAAGQRLMAEIFKALGHPTRLGIVLMLRDGERCVCDMVDELAGGQQSNISQHLSVLRKANILDSRKEGLSVFYRLRYPELLQLVGCAEQILIREINENSEALALR